MIRRIGLGPSWILPPQIVECGRSLVSLIGKGPMRYPRSTALFLLLVPCLTALWGCGWPGPRAFEVWVAESEQQVFPDSAPQGDNAIFSASRRSVTIAAAVNEAIGWQLAVRGTAEGDAVTSVSPSELRGANSTIPADRFTVYRMDPVRISDYPAWFYQRTPYRRAVREYPDVLVPVVSGSTALPAELPRDRNLLFWIDLRIPAGTSPGTYTGDVTVQTRSGASSSLRIDLEVYPFALPETPHITALAPLSWSTLVAHHVERDGKPYRPPRLVAEDVLKPAALGVLDAAFRLLRQHRCHGLLTDLYPIRQSGPDGSTRIDWSDYDAVAGPYLDGAAFDDRVPVPIWPLPLDERFPPADGYGGLSSAKYAAAVKETAALVMAHFGERGWLDQHVLMPGTRHVTHDDYGYYGALARVFSLAGDQARLCCRLPPQSMEPFGWPGHPYADLSLWFRGWCPTARYTDPMALDRLRRGGAWTAWQPDHPPYSGSLAVVSPPLDVRSIALQTVRWGADAVWLGGTDWPGEPPPGGIESAVTAETSWLLYPGKPFGVAGPVPSVRLKRLRDGLQDAEYLWLLRQRGRPAIADAVGSGLFAYGGTGAYGETHAEGLGGGWSRDGATWQLARRLVAAELIRAAQGAPAEEFEQFRQRVEWQRFLKATREVRRWVDGIRIRPDADASGLLCVEAVVTIQNLTSREVEAALDFRNLPAGWQAEPAGGPLRVAAGQKARRTVRLRTAGIDYGLISPTGVLTMAMSLAPGGAPPEEMPARLALMAPMRLSRPVTIDGRLDDWPPVIDNGAGDFVLLGGQDAAKTDGARPDRPTQETLVAACFDDRALYIAFSCEEADLDHREVSSNNFVRYEGMTPVGEDLVEVVLDPGASATGPGDLYHIVIKANGAVVTEQGIGCRPPIGAHRRWPADARAAVDSRRDLKRWFVELEVPWESFPEGLRRRPWWGANFTRLAARTGEYASWSGARWNVYTPVTMGNMYLHDLERR